MKKTKKLFSISLQHFADGETAAAETGLASPQNLETPDGSADIADNSISADMEFESLIKGGKYENAFKKRTQSIIEKRFKNYKALEDTRAKQQPVIDRLAQLYGLDPSDTQAILEKLQTDSRLTSADSPTPKDGKEDAVNKENADSFDADRMAAVREQLISQKAKALSNRWATEAKQLKTLFPDFSLAEELQNPAFGALLKSGMPLKKAYTALHSEELIKKAVNGTAMRVKEQTLKSIRANGSRVAENGLSSKGAITHKTDVASLTGKDIRSILQQVENGSKVRF